MHILHVEDNRLDADLAVRDLARSAPDMHVTPAESLAEARALLGDAARFDVVLIDLRLPDGSGFELLAEIRRRQQALAVVMLTGSGDTDTAVAALQAGADDYLCKDFSGSGRLAATLRDALRRHLEAASRRSRALRVLYVEPNTGDVDLTRRHLSRYAPHIELDVVSTADQALERLPLLPDVGTCYDVLMFDYRLKGLDALQAVKVLRAERGLDLPIVMVSGQGSEEIAAQAIHLGADAYLSKHEGYLHELPATLEKVHAQWALLRERRSLRAATERLGRVLAASPIGLYTLRVDAGSARLAWVSSNVSRLLGYSEEEVLSPAWWTTHLHPGEGALPLADLAALSATGSQVREYRFLHKSGHVLWLRDELRQAESPERLSRELIGAWQDVTESRLGEQLRETRMHVLDGVAGQQDLPAILHDIVSRLEGLFPEMRVSVLVRNPDSGRLFTGAAPSLPAFFNMAVDGLECKVGCGSCGSAAALGEAVFVDDLRTHPYWADYVEVAERAGLRSCWSIPFKDEHGTVLGTFGMYYMEPGKPGSRHVDVMGEFARIAGLAVERARAFTNLRQSAAVFESTSEGVVITDLVPRIIQINRAYTDITGYTAAEAVGRNPSLISSGRQSAKFYAALWKSVRETGHWRGEIWNRRKSGEVYPQILTISTVCASDGRPVNYVGVLTDITLIKQSEERLERLAHYDSLTELPNRLMLQFRLEHALQTAARQQHLVAVLFIDVDRFKHVNDSLGHPAGDEVLRMVAQRMSTRLREGDTLGRLGGDEFLVILEDVTHPGEAATVAAAIMQLMREPISLGSDHEVYVSISVGISLYPGDAQSVTELIQHADSAMYLAKENGRNNFKYYTTELTAAADARLALDSRMRRALGRGEFVVYYQPQIDMASGALRGCEALVRWQDPSRGLISPAQFIPLAEETGFIVRLGEWVLREACRHAMEWPNHGGRAATVSVNLSGRQLGEPGFVDQVGAILAESGLPADRLKLELTESTLMASGDDGVGQLRGLRALGLALAIDDFGTGYSSLAYLTRFTIDELKIDQSFVRGIPADANSVAVAATIIAMAHKLGLRVVAEGVETPAQLAFLREQGCQAYQGYLCSPAVPVERFTELLRELGERGPVEG